MGKISITWDRPSVCVIGAGGNHESLTLNPGANLVDSSTWEEVKKNRAVNQLLTDEALIEGEEVDESAGESLAAMKPGVAIRQVKETFDLKALGAWLKSESRPHVKSAIEAQIASIEAKGKPAGSVGGAQ